jgi:hypothetical protein
MTQQTRPTPGSDAAIEQGCTCPVTDNNHGRRPPYPPNGWWYDVACRVHGVDQEPPPEPSPWT